MSVKVGGIWDTVPGSGLCVPPMRSGPPRRYGPHSGVSLGLVDATYTECKYIVTTCSATRDDKTCITSMIGFHNLPWASYQIGKIADCACFGNAGNIFPATDSKGNRKLAIPACITARA